MAGYIHQRAAVQANGLNGISRVIAYPHGLYAPEDAALKDLSCRDGLVKIAVHERHGHLHAICLDLIHDLLCIAEAAGDGFLHKDVLARSCRLDGELGVHIHAREDDDRVDLRVGKHVAVIVRRFFKAILLRDLLRGLQTGVARIFPFDALDLFQRGQMIFLRDLAGATDHTDPDLVHSLTTFTQFPAVPAFLARPAASLPRRGAPPGVV